MPLPAPTNTWRTIGITCRATSPGASLSIGTRRQPSTFWPSSRMTFSTMRSHSLRWFTSAGRNTIPTPYCPAAGSSTRSAFTSRRKNASGICTRIPAPSPVFGSQPQAPRCVRFWRTVRPFCTISCEGSPFTFTTNPTPQASCSMRGSLSQFVRRSAMSRSPQVSVAVVRPSRAPRMGRRDGVLRIEPELHALDVGREDDRRFGPRHALHRADLRDHALERRRARGLHLEQEGERARDVMALEHVRERGHLLLEAVDGIRIARDDADERRDVHADLPAVDDRMIAGDHAGRFELLDALEHRRRGQADLLAESREWRSAVVLQ